MICKGVKSISRSGLKNCSLLDTVEIPDTLETIDPYAFENCTSLTKLVIPRSVTKIDGTSFKGITDTLTIYGYRKSYAETYAKANDIKFVPLDGEDDVTPGDITGDGKINMKDLSKLQQFINGWNVEINEVAADVNGDGKVNMKDYALIQRYINGWEVVLK